MLHVEAFLSCILIAAIGSAEGSPAPKTPFSFREVARQDILGPSFPNDTVYIEFNASAPHLALSTVKGERVSLPMAFDKCKYAATSRGAYFFEYQPINSKSGQCNIGTLQFPLCRTRQGSYHIYIQEQFLTNGTVNDGAILANLPVGPVLLTELDNPDDDFGTFRVQSPTILDFPEYYTSTDFFSKQTIITEKTGLVEVNDNILVDPVCYTNSSCGVPFVYPLKTHVVPANLAWLSKSCGELVTITPGQPRYILSHEGIGCQNFPDSGYGSGTCYVNYRGYSNTGVQITVEFVNFKDGDSCDGFSLSVVSFNTQTDKTMTRLCGASLTEIFSPVSRGRIDFSGIAKTGRKKYGFIIKLSDA